MAKSPLAVLLGVVLLLGAGADSARAHGPGHNPSRHHYIMRHGVPGAYKEALNPLSLMPENLASGRALYGENCAVCHGPDGNGEGPASYLIFPKPRNFARGQFKLRSTPMGLLPTDDDLVRTVSNGIPGTAMFDFGELLSEAELEAVVQHVKSLHPGFATTTPPTPDQLLQIPTAPDIGPELVAAGRQAYGSLRCAQCHGP